jgi:molybdenum cofactor biosynthesis enzyme MoaA
MLGVPTSLAEVPGSSQPGGAPPLFVAIHDRCDRTCWYCTERGENRTWDFRLPTPRLMEILAGAYAHGVRTFRLTGGEPTLRSDFAALLVQIQALGEDVRIAITTNGLRLAERIDALQALREPRIFLSIDGFRQDEYNRKPLSPGLERTIDRLAEVAHVRLNFVLTRGNADQLMPLIDYVTGRRIDLKIFELLHRDYFYAANRDPTEVFSEQFVSIRAFLPELRRRFGDARRFGGTGGRGIPMRAFRHGDGSRIIYFDSQEGSHYGDPCDRCPRYPCQEGLYALLLDINGMLHPAGCENRKLYIPLARASQEDLAAAFDRLDCVISEASLRAVPPKALSQAIPAA